jgi:hypothetical protein
MTLNKVYFGRFVSGDPNAQWDGTNEADLLGWLNTVGDGGLYSYDPANSWSITAQTGSSVTFEHATRPQIVILPLNGWISCWHGYVSVVNPAGAWITSDPHGRPGDLNDLLP